VESADAAPTANSYVVFEELAPRLETPLAAWKEIQAKDLPALNEMMQKNNIPAISPAPEKSKSAVE